MEAPHLENITVTDTHSVSVGKQFLHTLSTDQFERPVDKTDSTDRTLTPFAYKISPLAVRAAKNLQKRLLASPPIQNAKGKMFGVLVVRVNDDYHYLAAFSGKFDGHWHREGYVPPPFNTALADKLLQQADVKIKTLDEQINSEDFAGQLTAIDNDIHTLSTTFKREYQALCDRHRQRKDIRHSCRQQLTDHPLSDVDASPDSIIKDLDNESSEDRKLRKTYRRRFNKQIQLLEDKAQQIKIARNALKKQRQDLSRRTQKEYFDLFNLIDRYGQKVSLAALGTDQLPPAGTGECAGAKLLAFALMNNLEPVAMAEFWWGTSPGGDVRHHGNYYPSCRSKCGLLIPALLGERDKEDRDKKTSSIMQGQPNIQVEFASSTSVLDAEHIPVLYEDNYLAVVEKPAGVLSVPGKTATRSVRDWAAEHWPNASGPLLVHRLDMDTSGVLLIAKDHRSYVNLQRQFAQQIVEKFYMALVAGLPDSRIGQIKLPLRVDLDDRPRQLVCNIHGKEAITYWRILDSGNWAMSHAKPMLVSRLQLKPLTGRTHQLRVHCASVDGLNLPIIGDRLYGRRDITLCSDFYLDQSRNPADNRERMMLHAASLSFVHPGHQKRMTINSAVPF